MQDRFLFRVWDKKSKTYDCSPYGENALTESGEMFWIENSSDCSEVNEEYFTVEQCTGLKDKNGKLIYEGDRINVCYSCFDGVGFSDHIYSGTVVWDGYSLVIQEDGNSIKYSILFTAFHFFDGQSDEIEVVGNSHKNKKG